MNYQTCFMNPTYNPFKPEAGRSASRPSRWLLVLLLTLAVSVGFQAGAARAQDAGPEGAEKSAAQEREALHLNTIGAFSAGFALQSYGYIGVLADALSKNIYPPDLVISMLTETTNYLRNINTQLQKYQNNALVAPGDRKFISSMMEIVTQLIAEADALSSFAKTKSADDLKRFEEARKNAWKNIKKTFGMN